MTIKNDEIISATRRWLEKSVIGLGLCPFAKSVYAAGRVRLFVSEQQTPESLLQDLERELMVLYRQDPQVCETTLLIHPWALREFADYNDFLSICDAALVQLDLEGELQIASFHPQYQFAGTQPDDIENYTNRSPYPMLHLLREDSIEQAIDGVTDTDAISANNIRIMRDLGHQGWLRLWRDF